MARPGYPPSQQTPAKPLGTYASVGWGQKHRTCSFPQHHGSNCKKWNCRQRPSRCMKQVLGKAHCCCSLILSLTLEGADLCWILKSNHSSGKSRTYCTTTSLSSKDFPHPLRARGPENHRPTEHPMGADLNWNCGASTPKLQPRHKQCEPWKILTEVNETRAAVEC